MLLFSIIMSKHFLRIAYWNDEKHQQVFSCSTCTSNIRKPTNIPLLLFILQLKVLLNNFDTFFRSKLAKACFELRKDCKAVQQGPRTSKGMMWPLKICFKIPPNCETVCSKNSGTIQDRKIENKVFLGLKTNWYRFCLNSKCLCLWLDIRNSSTFQDISQRLSKFQDFRTKL